jgi:hypothetical protein
MSIDLIIIDEHNRPLEHRVIKPPSPRCHSRSITMFYIGFEKLSEFIRAIDFRQAVYLAPLSIVKTSDYLSSCTVSLVASQPKGDHLIYCKIDISRWGEMRGEPFGPEAIDRAARAPQLQKQMWEFIVEQLRADDSDLEIFDGAPSFPSDLMLVPGNIEEITYNAELHEFERAA